MVALFIAIAVFFFGLVAICFGLVEFLLFLFAGDFLSALAVLAVAFAVFTLGKLIAVGIAYDSEYEITEFLKSRRNKRKGEETLK